MFEKVSMSHPDIKLFKITADYRPLNDKSPTYYVHGYSDNHAKKRFESCFVWLKVYKSEECEEKTGMWISLDR